MIYSSSERLRGPIEETHARRSARPLLLVNGRRMVLPPGGGVVGRSRECEVVLDDSGVSRKHAEIRPSAEGWAIVDLNSTNGVRVNDRRIDGARELRSGDRIELGSTRIVFEQR
jgi:predicted component of type VI protein secretion system